MKRLRSPVDLKLLSSKAPEEIDSVEVNTKKKPNGNYRRDIQDDEQEYKAYDVWIKTRRFSIDALVKAGWYTRM